MTAIKIGAIYGRDYYGRATYGPRPVNDLAIDPFVVTVTSFDTVTLSWQEPGGQWDGFRILRNPAGFPMDERDGQAILDNPIGYEGATGRHTVDTDLPGGWMYYAAFLHNSDESQWERVATEEVLVPFDYDSTDFIWNLVPEYYKEITDTGAGYSQVKYRINPAIYRDNDDVVANQQLVEYLNIFGWGLDFLRTETDTILDGYDPYAVHYNRLGLLAEQFGAQLETSVPASANRSLVRNLGSLYRMRGTLNGIRELLSLVSGWDVEVTLGPNLMLSDDQASFSHPDPQIWDYTIRYNAGDRVKFGLYLYQATQVAYGPTQGPPVTNINNAYWNHDGFIEPKEDRSVARQDTGDVSTWQVLNSAGQVIPSGTFIGQGATVTDDDTLHWANVLGFWNTGTTTSDFTVRSVPRLLSNLDQWDKQLIIESGIPVPRPTRQYVYGQSYSTGDKVMFLGSPYEARLPTKALPSDASTWFRLGYDDRVRMCLSYYTHAADSGVPHTGGKICHPYIAEFDENGDTIQELVMIPSTYGNQFYDPFNVAGNLTGGRTPAVGPAWAVDGVGTWIQGTSDVGGYVYPPAGRTFQLAPGTLASDVRIAATYRSLGSRSIGIVFRYTNPSNFWIATQTGLKKVVAGVVSNPANGAVSWDAFLPGDRMTVTLQGTNIVVYRNGPQIVGATNDGFNSTGTRHGVEAEA